MSKHSLVRTIYLYLFALVGLTLVVIGTVNFVNMGLKAFIFTKAEDPERVSQEYRYYNTAPLPEERFQEYQAGAALTEEEETAIKVWYQDYQEWQERQSKVDYLASRRQEDAARNLAFILIGLPLYLYHWQIIKRETKEKDNKKNS